MESWLCGLRLLADLFRFLGLSLQPRTALAAENLFLRKQLAFYQEREVRPRRLDQATRLTLVWLSRWFAWRDALSVVTPRTFIGWHRKGFALFWCRKSRSGRPQIPTEVQELIRRMAAENPTWGEERIASELLLKLGLRVSPRTVLLSRRTVCTVWLGGSLFATIQRLLGNAGTLVGHRLGVI